MKLCDQHCQTAVLSALLILAVGIVLGWQWFERKASENAPLSREKLLELSMCKDKVDNELDRAKLSLSAAEKYLQHCEDKIPK